MSAGEAKSSNGNTLAWPSIPGPFGNPVTTAVVRALRPFHHEFISFQNSTLKMTVVMTDIKILTPAITIMFFGVGHDFPPPYIPSGYSQSIFCALATTQGITSSCAFWIVHRTYWRALRAYAYNFQSISSDCGPRLTYASFWQADTLSSDVTASFSQQVLFPIAPRS